MATKTAVKRKARDSDRGLDLAATNDDEMSALALLGDIDDEQDEDEEDDIDGDKSEGEEEQRPELELDDDEEEELRTLLSNGVDGVFSEDEDEDEAAFSELSSGDELSSKTSDMPNYTLTLDANGGERYIYDEIAPVYDSDDSATLETNTIGNIPLSFYDSYPHIGYDINGKKISRPARGEALDTLLDSIDVPKGWTGLTDPNTGAPLQLKPEELKLLAQIQRGELQAVNGDGAYDPYPDLVEYFTNTVETMPLSSAPEPKRRFIPSKHEQKRVMKIVRAIKLGYIKPWREEKEESEDEEVKRYDIWADEAPRKDHVMHVPAPKLPPPGYDESYHPPPEYLPDEEERKKFDEADEEDRERDFLPTDHDALRKVKGYEKFIKDRFERCLDLYLAPRVRRKKLNIDPESLLPKLPAPEDLRPFPSTCATVFRGHMGRVRSVNVDPSGCWLASGGDDGTVKVWDIKTGRLAWSVLLSDERITRDRNVEAVSMVRWRPAEVDGPRILAAACGDDVYLMVPQRLNPDSEAVDSKARAILDAGFGYAAQEQSNGEEKRPTAKWTRPGSGLEESNVLLKISLSHTVKVIAWHRRGEYFCSVSPSGSSNAVAIHSLSKHLTQLPFRKLKGYPQSAIFHPSKPHFLVATQRLVRIYDLQKQTLLRILQPGARWISSLDIHPQGDNVLVSSYDKRLLWHDLDLSTRPYKTLRYHSKAIRATKFHGRHPLFADASDDGTVQVFHGKVVGDLLENATIVPLKVLRGHTVKTQLGVLDLDWHPREPWLVSAGADGTCRLWC